MLAPDTRYSILSATAVPIPIPILEMTSSIAWGKPTLRTLHSVRYVSKHNVVSIMNCGVLAAVSSTAECISYNETNYRLETIGVHATVLTVKTGKRTTGIGADTKISIGRYRYPLILAGIGGYPIPDTGIGLTLILCLLVRKFSCWHTNKPTNRSTNRFLRKHPTFFAMLRRVKMQASSSY